MKPFLQGKAALACLCTTITLLALTSCKKDLQSDNTKPLTPKQAQAEAVAAATYQLVWSDEFNYTGLPDSTKWSYNVGGHGWANNELQYYTKNELKNARVATPVLLEVDASKKDIFSEELFGPIALLIKTKNNDNFFSVFVHPPPPL